MKKNGFTLMELILSIIMVGIVIVALISLLLSVRNTYDSVNSEMDAKTNKALVSKVINDHMMNNGGIKNIECSDTLCNIILGNNKLMKLELTKNVESEEEIKENNNIVGIKKNEITTIKYYGNNYNYLKSIKMTTLEYNSGKKIENGYKFVKINYNIQSYPSRKGNNLVDKITNITIEMNNPKYNIDLYSMTTVENDLGILYTLTYDNNGGHGCVSEVKRDGNNWGPLCIPQRDNYGFLGWFNQPDGGQEILDIDKVLGNKTIYAHWSNKRYSCDAGTYLPKNSTECEECLENNYCPKVIDTLFDKVKDQGIINCLSGYQSISGSKQITDCKINCPQNTYIENKNDSSCKSCLSGYVSNESNISQGLTSTCVACGPGTYANGNNCIECPNGSYSSSNANINCTLCGSGKIGTGSGKKSESEGCKSNCESGYTLDNNGKCISNPSSYSCSKTATISTTYYCKCKDKSSGNIISYSSINVDYRTKELCKGMCISEGTKEFYDWSYETSNDCSPGVLSGSICVIYSGNYYQCNGWNNINGKCDKGTYNQSTNKCEYTP